MSRHNKVNPDHYKMAGRLPADDLAREQSKQGVGRPVRGVAASKVTSQKKGGAATKRRIKATR